MREMRRLQLISAFVEISTNRLSVKTGDLMFESRIKNDQCQFPVARSLPRSSKIRVPEDQRCTLSITSCGACSRATSATCTDQQGSHTVTLYVIINSISRRNKKGILRKHLPIQHRYLPLLQHAHWLPLLYNELNPFICMGNAELYFRLIRNAFQFTVLID